MQGLLYPPHTRDACRPLLPRLPRAHPSPYVLASCLPVNLVREESFEPAPFLSLHTFLPRFSLPAYILAVERNSRRSYVHYLSTALRNTHYLKDGGLGHTRTHNPKRGFHRLPWSLPHPSLRYP
jgi:hypothetical protein